MRPTMQWSALERSCSKAKGLGLQSAPKHSTSEHYEVATRIWGTLVSRQRCSSRTQPARNRQHSHMPRPACPAVT
eukprot:366147-Chlamydomonas_euryale.AAC.3